MELHPIDLLRREAPRWLGILSGRLEPVLDRLRGLPRRHLVLGAVAVLALLAAIGTWLVSNSEEAAPSDQFVGFRCEKCGEYFEMSHRQFERVWVNGRYGPGHDGKTLLFQCSKCGEMAARRANRNEPATSVAVPGSSDP